MRVVLLILVWAISRTPLRSVRSAAIVICIAIGLPAVLTKSVESHTHVEADGTTVSWYPQECCHQGDCRPVVQVQRGPAGLWMTTSDGLTVLVGPRDARRASRDMRWHVCIALDDTETQKIRCVFEPPNS
jgi:hypothetical protein